MKLGKAPRPCNSCGRCRGSRMPLHASLRSAPRRRALRPRSRARRAGAKRSRRATRLPCTRLGAVRCLRAPARLRERRWHGIDAARKLYPTRGRRRRARSAGGRAVTARPPNSRARASWLRQRSSCSSPPPAVASRRPGAARRLCEPARLQAEHPNVQSEARRAARRSRRARQAPVNVHGAWTALLVLFAAACARRPGAVRWRRADGRAAAHQRRSTPTEPRRPRRSVVFARARAHWPGDLSRQYARPEAAERGRSGRVEVRAAGLLARTDRS